MSRGPTEFTLELTPRARVDVIDVRNVIASRFGDALDAYPRALCCSFHTTAGYLDRGVAARLKHNASDVMPYIDVFRTMFPEGAGYEHDKMDRRMELTAEQRPREPRNADSHLAFMAGALRTCVSYPEPRRRADRVRGSRWRARRSGAAAPDHRARILRGGARRAVANRRPHLEPLGRFGEPEGSQPGRLRDLRATGGRARRDEGTDPLDAGVRRAPCRADRQRIRNAADAA